MSLTLVFMVCLVVYEKEKRKKKRDLVEFEIRNTI